MTYTFPLSPTMLNSARASLSSYSDTQGPAFSQGVSRVMDRYGLAPPIFSIEGTTGWDFHNRDGYAFSGLQSLQRLASFFETYATLNEENREVGNPYPYTLEFYDYFLENFWQIEPVGDQIFRQDQTRPQLVYYRFRWVAIQPAGMIFDIFDPIDAILAVGASVAATTLGQGLSTLLGNYTAAGPLP